MTLQRRWTLGGGIASGKSVVRELLAEAGVAAIDSDAVGHEVLAPGGPAFLEVAQLWPQVVKSHRIDRPALAGIVFSDPAELRRLESITHPLIFDRIRSRVEKIDSTVVVEVPIIGHGLGIGWRTLVVDCPDELRIKRAVARGMTEEDVRARMSQQPSRSGWLAVADMVLPNRGSEEQLLNSIGKVVRHL